MKTITTKTIAAAFGILFLGMNANATITDALKVKVINGTSTDETVIRFVAGATTAFDGSYDAYKMFSSSPAVPAAFTQIDAANRLSVNALPALSEVTDIELFIHVKVAGTYTLQATELGAFLPGTRIALEDKLDGSMYYFKNGASVSFPMTVNTVNSASRFVIHFRPVIPPVSSSRLEFATSEAISIDETAGADEPAMESDQLRGTEITAVQEDAALKAYVQDGQLVMNAELNGPATLTIMIYTISGQKIYSHSSVAENSFHETALLPASGTYIIYSVINRSVHSQKINYIN